MVTAKSSSFYRTSDTGMTQFFVWLGREASPPVAIFNPESRIWILLERGSRDQETIAGIGVDGRDGKVLSSKNDIRGQ